MTLKIGFDNLNFCQKNSKNLPMGLCVGGDVLQRACPHWAAPWRSCLGGGGAGVEVLGLLGLLGLLRLAAQSSRSSKQWGTPR